MFDTRIADRLEIQDLIYRWSRGVDRRDWDLVRSVFHPDATDAHGVYNGDIDGLIAWLKVRHTYITQSMHLIGNILIDFAGPDKAVVESYVTAKQRYVESAQDARVAMLGKEAGSQPGTLDMDGMGRYVDIVERRDGAWKILSRVSVYEGIWTSLAPEFPKLDPNWPLATRDEADPLYVAQKAVGFR